MKTKFYCIIAAMAALAMVACSKEEGKEEQGGKEEPQEEVEVISVSPETASFDCEGGTFVFTVLANYDWTVTCPAWMNATPASGAGDKNSHEVSVTVSAYSVETEDRTGDIKVSLPKGECAVVTVTQTRKPHVDPKPTSISSADDFVLWMEHYAATETGTMTLEKDIDMSEVDFTPATEFAGTFDGKGHAIKNLKSPKPLFVTMSGTVKDLILDAGCEFASSDIEYVSSFVGLLSGTMSGCTNNGKVVVKEQNSARYIGGLCSYTEAGAKIENCTNNGSVDYIPATHSSDIYAGGLAGYNKGDMKDIVNNGAVTLAPEICSAGKLTAGGLSGAGYSGTAVNCVNNGKLDCHFEGSLGSEVRVGGFFGEGTLTICTACKQFGDVYCPVVGTKYRVGGLTGFQMEVKDGNNYNVFEDCAINCTVTGCQGEAKKAPQWEGGNDVGSSLSMIVGRMSGQSGKGSNLYFGTEAKPVKMAGTLVSTGDVEKTVVITADNYRSYVCGGGSATNYAGDPASPCTWQVFNAVYQAVSK